MLVQIRSSPLIKKQHYLNNKLRKSQKKYENLYTIYKSFLNLDVKPMSEEVNYIWYYQNKLSKVIKSNYRSKLRNICLNTGKNRSVYTKVQFSRTQIRDLSTLKLITGLRKSGW